MIAQPDRKLTVPAGCFPAALLAACAVCRVKPSTLLGWALKPDEVTLILATGQKVSLAVYGGWVMPRANR